MPSKLTLQVLPEEFAITKLDAAAAEPEWVRGGPMTSVTRTADELSIVCLASQIPETMDAERGFACVRVKGPLNFDLVGVLASMVGPLARAGISVFSVSTFDTDYLLLPNKDIESAIECLRAVGHSVQV